MYAILLKTVMQVAAGLGIGKLLDVFGKKSVPQYTKEPILPGTIKGLLWLGGLIAVGLVLVKFMAKQLKINILK